MLSLLDTLETIRSSNAVCHFRFLATAEFECRYHTELRSIAIAHFRGQIGVSCPVSHPASYSDSCMYPGIQNLHLYFNLAGYQVLESGPPHCFVQLRKRGDFEFIVYITI